MSTDIDSIKRKLLVKYPMFGSITANTDFVESAAIPTAATTGKVIYYNSKYINSLDNKQKVAIFAHEICHIAFKHIERSEGKDAKTWNIATDAVINALLKQDGLSIGDDGISIPEAVNYDAETMYNKLLKEKQQQNSENESNGTQENSSENNENKQNQVGPDTHELWEEAVKEMKKEQQNSQNSGEQQGSQQEDNGKHQNAQNSEKQQGSQKEGNGKQRNSQNNGEQQENEQQQNSENESNEKQGNSSDSNKSQSNSKQGNDNNQESQQDDENKQALNNEKQNKEKDKQREKDEQINDFGDQGEPETFKQNRIERKKQLQELSHELVNQASKGAGTETQREGKRLKDIGIAKPLIDWRRLLREAIKYNQEYTRKNARMRNDYFRHKLQDIPIPETEIVLDTSGSVSEVLLKNFLRECKNIIANSKVKVGCFNTEFHGFTELRKIEDIDKMHFPIGGGTDFDVAVEAFSRRANNKIIFTDGKAPTPKKAVKNVIWVIFGDRKINPRGGKVISITGKQLEKLYGDRGNYDWDR